MFFSPEVWVWEDKRCLFVLSLFLFLSLPLSVECPRVEWLPSRTNEGIRLLSLTPRSILVGLRNSRVVFCSALCCPMGKCVCVCGITLCFQFFFFRSVVTSSDVRWWWWWCWWWWLWLKMRMSLRMELSHTQTQHTHWEVTLFGTLVFVSVAVLFGNIFSFSHICYTCFTFSFSLKTPVGFTSCQECLRRKREEKNVWNWWLCKHNTWIWFDSTFCSRDTFFFCFMFIVFTISCFSFMSL